MYRFPLLFLVVLLVGCNPVEPPKSEAPIAALPQGNSVVIETVHGEIAIELRPDLAPKHAERVKELAQSGFYDGVVFHRVIEGFMAQTGDPTGTGTGGSDLPDLKAEFSKEPFKRGVLGMARSQSPDSANSQFFIMLADGEFLNNKYTVFGRVVSGMEVVDKIKKGNPDANGKVDNPDSITKMRVSPASS